MESAMGKNCPIILVSFGGPRNLDEVGPFLQELLTDQEMVRTPLPAWLHRHLFSLIAKVRTPKLKHAYQLIGGRSPIVADTVAVAHGLSEILKRQVIPFYRYLPSTHASFLNTIGSFTDAKKFAVFPLYPQQSVVTTGSARKWISERVSKQMDWVLSYASHPAFVQAWVNQIQTYLNEQHLREEEVMLLFSAHGLPQKIVDGGDPYEQECESSFSLIAAAFPKVHSMLAYQSKVGVGHWLQPETEAVCREITSFSSGRRHVVFIPISFTSDHIETLYEIEHLYLPQIRRCGLNAYRCPAFGSSPQWIHTISEILRETLNNCCLEDSSP